MPPLLFVHGAWHGTWCWDDYFLPWFRERGWNCAVVHLRGHGDGLPAARLRWLSAARYLDDLCTAIQRQPRPPVLVAHSMGGYLALKVLERHRLPGAALLAPVPIMGSLPAFLRSGWTNFAELRERLRAFGVPDRSCEQLPPRHLCQGVR